MDTEVKIISIIFAIIIGIICVIFYKQDLDNPNSVMYSKIVDVNRIEYLEDEIEQYKKNEINLNAKLEEIKDDYEYDEQLIEVLRGQLLEQGIEPEKIER